MTSGRARWTGVRRTRRNFISMAGVASAYAGAALLGLLVRPKPAKAAVCFLSGTHIWTPDGESKVEELRINDLVVTSSGDAKPIEWIWRHRFQRQSEDWSTDILPIRVMQSALGPNNPHRDLFLSPGHRLYLDGVLVGAADLVNGRTIVRCKTDDLEEVEYFHIKLERHSVIYAEGAACATLQNGRQFKEYRGLYGQRPEEPACAPTMGYVGGRSILRSRFRSAISPIVDVRTKFDVLRDNLEERAAMLPLG